MNTMNQRHQIFDRLRADPRVSVLILGGGINGIGLFRELSLQGVRCLLVDRADFTSGATSKSSRMIHGGLRYLENREFALVRESLLERNHLLDNAPHYVSPLRTTIPFFNWFGGIARSAFIFLGLNLPPAARGALITRLGLHYYDFVTRRTQRTPPHRFNNHAETFRSLPALDPSVVASATYWDAMITEAERLCIEMIHDAQLAQPDSTALNYIAPLRLENNRLHLRDLAGNTEFFVEPQLIVNATGAWLDATNATLGMPTHFMGGTKGSHLVVDCPALFDALGDQMIYYQHSDGRVCIAYRFLDKVILGSTDISVENPDTADWDEAEVDYMLAAVRDIFSGIAIGREHVVFAYCGVRPLPAENSSITANISRGHTIHIAEREVPIISLIGGKWTTFRALAEQTADKILHRLGTIRRCATDKIPIGGGKDFPVGDDARAAWIARVADASHLPATRVSVLLQRYGVTAELIAMQTDSTPLCSLPEYSVGEIEWIAAREFVEHLDDLVYRRGTIGLLGKATPEALRELAAVAERILGWDAARQEREISTATARRCAPPRAAACG